MVQSRLIIFEEFKPDNCKTETVPLEVIVGSIENKKSIGKRAIFFLAFVFASKDLITFEETGG